MIIHSDQKNFEEIRTTNKLFLLDVFATWCMPCQMLGAEFEKVTKDNSFFDVVKIDSDENFQLAAKLGVMVLPTMFVYKDGVPVEKIEGYIKANEIEEIMKKYIQE